METKKQTLILVSTTKIETYNIIKDKIGFAEHGEGVQYQERQFSKYERRVPCTRKACAAPVESYSLLVLHRAYTGSIKIIDVHN